MVVAISVHGNIWSGTLDVIVNVAAIVVQEPTVESLDGEVTVKD